MGRILQFIAFASLVAFVPIGTGAAQHGNSDAPVAVLATAAGVQFTMIVPRAAYPRNALVRVTMVVQNTSNGPVLVRASNRRTVDLNPVVEAQRRDGTPVRLPIMNHFWLFPGPFPGHFTLAPRQTWHTHRWVVLAGPRLVAFLAVENAQEGSPLTMVTTSPLDLTLTVAIVPKLTVHVSKRAIYASITRTAPSHGRVHFIESGRCRVIGGLTMDSRWYWSPVSGTRIKPMCTRPEERYVVAGWPNQPVATATYLKPG